MAHKRIPIFRRGNACDTIELPEPLVNTVNLHSTRATFTRLVYHNAVERDQRASYANTVRDKLASLFEISGELFAEEVWRGYQIVSLAQPARGKIAQTITH